VETDVNKDDSVQNTYQFGIKNTAEQFTETKLLKILNDAAVLHFLYHDILSWASEAKRNQYSFCPQRLERSLQVKYLEKWLHLAPCRPETAMLVLPGPAMKAIQVTWFCFTNQLYAILTDPTLVGNLDNLDVNPAHLLPSTRLLLDVFRMSILVPSTTWPTKTLQETQCFSGGNNICM
jgi:hypothetical protein